MPRVPFVPRPALAALAALTSWLMLAAVLGPAGSIDRRASARVDAAAPASVHAPTLGERRPVTGHGAPGLPAFDALMAEFMTERGIGGGVLAVMRGGVVVHERGYGWRDEGRSEPMPPDALMRVASVSKPITAAAIRVLVADGRLSLEDAAFDVGQPGGGILDLDPFPALGDARLAKVTVEHLLQHRGGWDRDVAGDLTYREIRIAAEMGVASPPGRTATLRWILGQPLQHEPGTKEAYSNIGYLALGMIVEQLAGAPLLEVVHERVLGPLGVARTELVAGRTFARDHDPREPFYDAPGRARNVFDPGGPRVPPPYGSWDHEARIAQGGQVTTARTLLAFLEARYISGPSIGRRRSGTEGPNWRRNHTGSLAGTSALARQRADGVHYVVILNRRPLRGTSYAAQFRSRMDELLDGGDIAWPGVAARPTG